MIKNISFNDIISLYSLDDTAISMASQFYNVLIDFYGGKSRYFFPCNAPYSDLNHVIFTALTAGRIIKGMESHNAQKGAVAQSTKLVIFLSSIFHDIGFLRRRPDEKDIKEGSFTFRHIERGIKFITAFLKGHKLKDELIKGVAFVISKTALYEPSVEIPPPSSDAVTAAGIVETADILAQVTCPDMLSSLNNLWKELNDAYNYEQPQYLKKISAVRYESYQDMLLNIIEFYDSVLVPRLERAGSFHLFLDRYFGNKTHFYREGIKKNYAMLTQNRGIILEVIRRLFASTSIHDMKNHILSHIRRLFGARAIIIITKKGVIHEGKAIDEFVREREGDLKGFLSMDAQDRAIFIESVTGLSSHNIGLPQGCLLFMYPLLSKFAFFIKKIFIGEKNGVILLVLPQKDKFLPKTHIESLIADIGTSIIEATLRHELRGERHTPAPERFTAYVSSKGIMHSNLAKRLIKQAVISGEPLQKVLSSQQDIDEEEATNIMAASLGMPYIDLNLIDPSLAMDKFFGLSLPFLRRHLITPYKIAREKGEKGDPNEKEIVYAAVADPITQDITSSIEALFGKGAVKISLASPASILAFIDKALAKTDSSDTGHKDLLSPDELKAISSTSQTEALDTIDKHSTIQTSQDDVSMAISHEDSMVVRLSKKIIIDAISQRASDIHIEYQPISSKAQIRFRVHGRMRHYMDAAKAYIIPLISRYKIMAHLDISEKRVPQDGRIRLRTKDGPIDIRIATLPRGDGLEDVVIRLLRQERFRTIDELMFAPEVFDSLRQCLKRPSGLFIVSGPTGSGKTTTIHAFLNFIKEDTSLKIWTAEDPIEIVQDGISQIQISRQRSFGFSDALKAFLRADPDVIFIGEMRDPETAKTAIRAALTGHLVLTTLHTGGSVEAILRLNHLGINGLDIAEALIGILTQRLLPRLCPECMEKVESKHLTDTEKNWIKAVTPPKMSFNRHIYRKGKRGCKSCTGTGITGRVPVHELLEVKTDIKGDISNLNMQGIKEAIFKRDTWISMAQDAIRKMEMGIIGIDDIMRIF